MFETINALFSSVADRYDLMNDVMSLGLHRVWKEDFVEGLPCAHLPDTIDFLDMSCGTGDIALRFLRKADAMHKKTQALLCDPNTAMLEKCKEKTDAQGMDVTFVETAAEKTPFSENSIDLYTISFGLRNVHNRAEALQEALRLLRPGGFFYCLEFSMPPNPLLQMAYRPYLGIGLPLLGALVARNASAYRYLGESIKAFPSPIMLETEMANAGFVDIGHRTLSEGIVAVHWGRA